MASPSKLEVILGEKKGFEELKLPKTPYLICR